jgi:hypothetical protein
MKKLTLILVALLVGQCSFAQEILITESAELKLPGAAQRIGKEEMLARATKLSNHSNLPSTRLDHIYKIGNMTLVIYEYIGSPKDKTTLEYILERTVGFYKSLETMTLESAAIRKINKQRFIVINYRQEYVKYIRFKSDRKNFRTINGILEYSTADKDEAEATILELLENLKRK